MFDPLGSNKGDNDRRDRGPRIIFANLRHQREVILSESGYKVFSATAFSFWALIVFVLWTFHFDVTLSQELITALASSSVELAALSLATLGILHELNKTDRWFKLGLLLVSIFFVGVVCGGYLIALTWQPLFALPQRITIIVVGVLAFVAFVEIDWEAIFKRNSVGAVTTASLLVRRIRLLVPFVPPVFLIWLPGLTELRAL